MRKFFPLYVLIIAALCYSCGGRERKVNPEGQVFRYNESKGISTLDPAFARNLALIWPVNQLFNGLVQLSDSLTVQPCIAGNGMFRMTGYSTLFYSGAMFTFRILRFFPMGWEGG